MPGTALAQWGLQTAGQVLGTGMGLLLGRDNDRRQLAQQEKLQALQIKGNKEMADYNQWKQKQMWEATNYPAQVEQLKKAGLNPALLYGMGGAGGATTGGGAGTVTGAQAPSGGGEAAAFAGMGITSAMNIRLMQEQADLLKAQTEKTKAETTKTTGVDTQESQARIESLLQGVDNARQQHQIQKLEITLKNIENFEKQATQEDRMDYIEYQTKIAMKQLQMVSNEAKLSDETLQSKIQIIQREAIAAGLRNELTKTQTAKTAGEIKLNDTQINMWIQSNMREWDKMTQENKRIAIQQLLGEFNTDPINKATDQISHFIDGIFFLTPKISQGRTVIEGFKQRY